MLKNDWGISTDWQLQILEVSQRMQFDAIVALVGEEAETRQARDGHDWCAGLNVMILW